MKPLLEEGVLQILQNPSSVGSELPENPTVGYHFVLEYCDPIYGTVVEGLKFWQVLLFSTKQINQLIWFVSGYKHGYKVSFLVIACVYFSFC